MKKGGLFWIVILFMSGTLLNAGPGDSFSISGTAHYFQPSDEFFKNIYGNEIIFGGEIGIKLWKWVSIWAAADFYSKKGKTTFTEEATEIQITPIFGGLMFQFRLSGFRPYMAFGVGYFQYKETNPIGKVEKQDMGYIVQAGFRLKAIGPLLLDMKASYSVCKVKPADIKADLGGFRAGVGLGLEF